MKLIYRILLRIALCLTVIFTLWSVLFYIGIVQEVNDEVDDSLEDYSEMIIVRALAGASLPTKDSGSNNQYYLRPVSEAYAQTHPIISYADSMVYIREKGETEPARILTTLFSDAHGQHYQLTVSVPTIEKADLKEAIMTWIVVLYVILLVVILCVFAFIFQRSMQPLYHLLSWLDAYRIGGENKALHNKTDVLEFRQLNAAILRSTARSEDSYEQQKQFIGNASHEMQTPLAICRNRLEMLMEDESLSEPQMEELSKTYDTLCYITRLNQSLLLLSKIDNQQFSERQELEVNPLIKRLIEQYEDVYAYMHIRCSYIEQHPLRLQMNETLFTILFSNLLKNAFVHNIPHGQIEVSITAQSLTISNSGAPHALDAEKIFQRFYQSQKQEGSTGLGLAIVHSICQLEHLHLHYDFVAQQHQFRLTTTST